ncbi:MAG: thiamine-phosphate kinase [Candidatus Eremiobacteraeota bacterium]|nr:thiamine-phosphate kinase [Candidatus Eremiobacteraeota bacterium]MBV8499403.1 thiamine-phosphate kinase [Candidatus Eremiobacteraeota bacterium]
MTEDEIIAAIRPLTKGIGDDAALWQPSRSHRSAISSDMLVEGVHFTRDAMSLEDVGWRAMTANVSDLAATGARPVLATVALGLAPAIGIADVMELYGGFAACAAEAGFSIVGGDLSRSDALTIAIAVVGEVRASNAKSRGGGRPGDVLAVTGALGAARAGLELTRAPVHLRSELERAALCAFRRPQARLSDGRFLAASRNVDAMIDCSDGLSTDLARLCEASGCGATLESVPVAESAAAVAAARGEDPVRYALAGGEDFELLVAVRPRAFAHLAGRYAARFGRPLHRVGVLRAAPEIEWNGAPLERSGWDHFGGRTAFTPGA